MRTGMRLRPGPGPRTAGYVNCKARLDLTTPNMPNASARNFASLQPPELLSGAVKKCAPPRLSSSGKQAGYQLDRA